VQCNAYEAKTELIELRRDRCAGWGEHNGNRLLQFNLEHAFSVTQHEAVYLSLGESFSALCLQALANDFHNRLYGCKSGELSFCMGCHLSDLHDSLVWSPSL
jgi:hypothetical protein